MAQTYVASGNVQAQWDDQFFLEYMRQHIFSPYMGTSENDLIQVNEELGGKPGDRITFSLIRNLAGTGVTGNTRLKGAEEAIDNRSFAVEVDPLRHAVTMTKWEMQKSPILRPSSARTVLKNWALNRMRDDILAAMASINGVAYADASEAQKDAWLVDNADRVLFGNLKSNGSGTDHSAGLVAIDNTDDKLTPASIGLMKRMAKTASPAIRPLRVTMGDAGQREFFVLFANSWAFRDLRNNATTNQLYRDAWMRGEDNPLFSDGDLIIDGVIIREVPEIGTVSNGTIAVGPNYFCGAQAIAVAYAQRDRSVVEKDDYDWESGLGIECIRGIKKAIFGKGATDTADTVDHGMLTGWFAAVADA